MYVLGVRDLFFIQSVIFIKSTRGVVYVGKANTEWPHTFAGWKSEKRRKFSIKNQQNKWFNAAKTTVMYC